MRRAPSLGALGLLAILPASAEEPAKPLDNWRDLRTAFVRCWTVPKGTEGSVVAFRFLFAPNGGLRGPPMVMAKILKGDDDAKKRYEAAAYRTLDRCLPITVTPGFKAVMGESLLLLSLMNTPRRPAPNLGPNMTIFAEETKAEGE
ncbi:hypothetical protein [Methylobacterium haplocladii]|uniref:Uncharacterized protein n=1 Tax=Methylobacterium haplocladii TaxID=1176176 RepID=A0A512IKV8_9HYPH|nr:hypothetical protein [Methylobacterium haplocladii]GEO98357.1 hypothetical protein MHA02_07450 [Methylobacterium haplocladii]GJD82985.1 hypothetical protein HPGCJGGD_0847 [Methylobacterium haplocladii]GLS58750.1 hypothetical protein GCM10007887_14150 [Methylobacterium haplocladii]